MPRSTVRNIGPMVVMQSPAELAAKMHDSVDFRDPAQAGRFMHGLTPTGEYFVALEMKPMDEWSNATWEIGPEGKVRVPQDRRSLHIVYSGTPHRTEHAAGYWHLNDADEIYFRTLGDMGEDVGTTALVMRQPRPGEVDIFAWYCENCLALLHAETFHSGDLREGPDGFYRAEDESVRKFNSDPSHRRCKACGAEHPLAYRAAPEKNSPEEEAARKLW